jgi:hypothetical protein
MILEVGSPDLGPEHLPGRGTQDIEDSVGVYHLVANVK